MTLLGYRFPIISLPQIGLHLRSENMKEESYTKPVWTDIAPSKLISEADVPERALELEQSANDFINGNARFFDPLNWEGRQDRYWRRKAFDEAGIYMFQAADTGRDDNLPALQELIIERVNDRRYKQLMLRSQNDFHLFVYPMLYADKVDRLDGSATMTLNQIAEGGEFWSGEQVPFRLLEFCLLSRIIGVPHEYDEEAILDYSAVNKQPGIIRSDFMDAYALTHDIMFYSNNYGDGTLRKAPYDLTTVLRGLILRYMAEDNCDLTLELLYAGILQRQISRQMVRLVLSWVLEKTNTAGYVPGPDADAMEALVSPKLKGSQANTDKLSAPWDFEHESTREKRWAKNYHTNVVAGMTARVLKRDWEELNKGPINHRFEEKSIRQDVYRLGELLKSLSEYDLEKGSRQMIELAGSPVITEFPDVFKTANNFIEDQLTQDGRFGYWADEEYLYIKKGNSRESFHTELASPITELCQKALDAVETSRQMWND